MEIQGGEGVVEKPSMGGGGGRTDIFWNYTMMLVVQDRKILIFTINIIS